MNKIVFIIGFALSVFSVKAQELNCRVTVGYDKITNVNPQIFKTLETSLNDFMNNTKWTSQSFRQNEKIECTMFINVNEFNSGNFSTTLQIQSSRPVYGSTFTTPILNFNDRDLSFRYIEFENLFYNPNSFDSNLTSVLAFYANIIIGMDADSFVMDGGTPYYEAAQNIVNLAQSSGFKGWKQSDGGNQNRFFLAQDLLSNTFSSYRKALYEYHLQGLDKMSDDVKTGKEGVKTALATLSGVHRTRPNAFLTRIFFDAKADEIQTIFSGGPQIPVADLVENLNRISPLNSSKWSNIKM
jgi:hypothetical protein